ncbi:hypothetical protein ACFPM0_03380 [Pseudonocardia sulfidoxydans]
MLRSHAAAPATPDSGPFPGIVPCAAPEWTACSTVVRPSHDDSTAEWSS